MDYKLIFFASLSSEFVLAWPDVFFLDAGG